ncbi:MAG TPA: hypothetical protein PLI17_00350 [Denitromonas sp.]|nr:hypothetical protein [Denitromonas sp.]
MKPVSNWVAVTAFSLPIAGCVTINIYFPAAAAEKAADQIIDEVWQLKPEAATKEGAPSR